jgi:hypothetical protein
MVAALSVSHYLLQGFRWQPLLRAVGAHIRLRDTLVLNFAGQAAGLLPAGELTRAVLVSEVAKLEVGKATATIAVREPIFTVLLIAAAVPGAFQRTIAAIGVSVALVVVLGVTAILTLHQLPLRSEPSARAIGAYAVCEDGVVRARATSWKRPLKWSRLCIRE